MCSIQTWKYFNTSRDVRTCVRAWLKTYPQECIDPWLETKAVCAYCKVKVEAQRSCCDRVLRSTSDRLGINLVAPTTIHFASSRRTYTNEDVSKKQYVYTPRITLYELPSCGGRIIEGGGVRGGLKGAGVGGVVKLSLILECFHVFCYSSCLRRDDFTLWLVCGVIFLSAC